jgi:putative hydrolase of the HAD superfamily
MNGKMSIFAVCFDLDGTLYDDRQYINAGLREAAQMLERRTGINTHEELLSEFYFGDDRTQVFDRVIDHHGLPSDLVPEMIQAYHDNNAELDPYPQIKEVLEDLYECYDLGIITDGRNGHDKIDRLGIRPYFTEIMVTKEHNISKREVTPFVSVLSSLSVRPSEAVYVGDNPCVDFNHPNRLGMHTIRLRRGLRSNASGEGTEIADVEIRSLNEIFGIINKL